MDSKLHDILARALDSMASLVSFLADEVTDLESLMPDSDLEQALADRQRQMEGAEIIMDDIRALMEERDANQN